MLLERVESTGLAHYSYIIGDLKNAVVIDPRRDCDIYVQLATREGLRITHILETHRNEDYVVGSVELASRTGAEILHADSELDYQYGQPVEDEQKIKVGRYTIEAISTPGHTPGSMSYLLHDPSGAPWIVFTGDALFAGDVGRTDLPGLDRIGEMTGLLYDSIFNKLLPLGDEVIVCPGHGAGSVCGEDIADRPLTTIGIERKSNPKLQYKEKDEFVENVGKEQERPPYFRKMEELNLAGAPILGPLPMPAPLSPSEFAKAVDKSIVLDTRMELGFSAAHVPGALNIWLDGLASFAGWFLTYDRPILLVNETNDPDEVVRILIRMGFDDLAGFLAGGMLKWHMAGKMSESIRTLTVQKLCENLDKGERPWILDVRSQGEIESGGIIPDAHHVHITRLPEMPDEIARDTPITIFCGSGMRSMIAASYLKREGWKDLAVVLGGLSGWKSSRCPIRH
jgi:hydroxyacylglutathione hydrolase